MNKTRPIVMVSSSVYGQESLLNSIYQLLERFGYHVYMSYKGTIPTNPKLNTVDNCLQAVTKCDFFFGIISTNYGTTEGKEDLSVTHEEIKKALETHKPCWFVVHEHVVFAKKFLSQLGFDSKEREKLRETFKTKPFFTDLRLIDMYELASQMREESGKKRVSWVQEYTRDEDVRQFVSAQFSNQAEIIRTLDELHEATKKPKGDEE